ncbi:TPA_asm: P3 [Garlic alphacytorhabdovirus 1]|nr:TPA_asm: P3 [Garlic alphacytorhabdovirus 1]
MLNVNDVRKSILKQGSLTAAVGTGTIYSGDMNRYARKRELNIIITSVGSKDIIMRQVPLFDQPDLDLFRKESDNNKYLHIGCITVSIEPLIHHRFITNYGNLISGHCAIVDASFNKLDESIISLHKYELKKGRADFVSYPNHCLSVTDPHIGKRLSVMLGINGIDVEPGTELFSLCIGYIITGVNTLNPTGMVGTKNFAITGAASAELTDIVSEDVQNMEESYNNVNLITNPSDNDIYYRSRGNRISSFMGIKGRDIKRRTMRLAPVQTPMSSRVSNPMYATQSKLPALQSSYTGGSQSSRLSKEVVYNIIRNKKIQEKINSARNSLDI